MTIRLALSVGCPAGIGPEVSAVAALEAKKGVRVLLVSSYAPILRAARTRNLDLDRLVRVASPGEGWALPPGKVGVWNPIPLRGGRGKDGDSRPGSPGPGDGAAQLAWIDAACDLAASGRAHAMVTGPVSKEVIASSGAPHSARFLGHTEHLQRRLKAAEVVMAFYNEHFTTALVTTHLPLAKVPRAITPRAVGASVYWLARFLLDLRRPASARKPCIAVASLNPHAGEGGLLGHEEERAIRPGIKLGRSRLERPRAVLVEGPLGAESVFRRALHDQAFDGVVAMYHDQATIPMKLIGFGESVNVSLGLPIIRTSVDHGTGYDIAGHGRADARGMREAIQLAVRLALAPRAVAAKKASQKRR
jgi:4-hydroxythreonine-4-phosphate dehydrogenase